MKNIILFFKALADPTRFKLVKLIQERPYCVCELTQILETSQPNVSRQLKILEDAMIVKCKRIGQRVEYSINELDHELGELLNIIKKIEENNPDIINLRQKAKNIGSCQN